MPIIPGTLDLNAWDKTYSIQLDRTTYANNGNLAITMSYFDEDFARFAPYATLTVNLDKKLPPNQAFVDVNNLGSDILCWIENNELGKFTGEWEYSGWMAYPLFEFDLEEVRKYE